MFCNNFQQFIIHFVSHM